MSKRISKQVRVRIFQQAEDFHEISIGNPPDREHCIDPLRPEFLSWHLEGSLHVLASTHDALRYEKAVYDLLGPGMNELQKWMANNFPEFNRSALRAGFTGGESLGAYSEVQKVIGMAYDAANDLVNPKFLPGVGRNADRGNDLIIVEFKEHLFPATNTLSRFLDLINSRDALADSISPSVNDPRDEWIYSEMKVGKRLSEIKFELNKHPTFEVITTEPGISQAAKRYAKRHSLPWPLN